MATTKHHRSRHHSNLRPAQKQTRDFLKPYWPFLPLLMVLVVILMVSGILPESKTVSKVLPYSTNVSTDELLRASNQKRTQNQIKMLSINPKLSEAAQTKAEDMAKRGYWSHDTPEGKAPWTFLSMVGYEYKSAGENLAYGFDNSDQVVVGWMNSVEHRKNVLSKDFTEVGFGFANSDDFDNNGQNTVVVALYAAPSPAEAVLSSASEKITPTIAKLNPSPKDISFAQIVSGGRLPWIQFAIGLFCGLILMYLIIKHTFSVKRAVVGGEKFILHHPLLDLTLIAVIVLLVIMSRDVGSIL